MTTTPILSHDLINALENESNGSIMDLTNGKIKEYKNNILQKLQFTREKLKETHKNGDYLEQILCSE